MEGGPRSYEHEADVQPDLLEVFADVEVSYAGFNGTFTDIADLCPIDLSDERITREMKNQFVAKLINEAGLEVPKEYEHEVARIVDQQGLERKYKVGESITVKAASEDRAKAERDKAAADAAVRAKTERSVKLAEPATAALRPASSAIADAEKIPKPPADAKTVGEVAIGTIAVVIEADSKDPDTHRVVAAAETVPVQDVSAASESNDVPVLRPTRQPETVPAVTLPVPGPEKPAAVIAEEETVPLTAAVAPAAVETLASVAAVTDGLKMAQDAVHRVADTDIGDVAVDRYDRSADLNTNIMPLASGRETDAWAPVIDGTAVPEPRQPASQPEVPATPRIEAAEAAALPAPPAEAEQAWLEEFHKTPDELFDDFLAALQIRAGTAESAAGDSAEAKTGNHMLDDSSQEALLAGLVVPDTADQLLDLINGAVIDAVDGDMVPADDHAAGQIFEEIVGLTDTDMMPVEDDPLSAAFDGSPVELTQGSGVADETMLEPERFPASMAEGSAGDVTTGMTEAMPVAVAPAETAAAMILAAVVLTEAPAAPFEEIQQAQETETTEASEGIKAAEAFQESARDAVTEETRMADLTLIAGRLAALEEAERRQAAPVIADIAGLVHGMHVLARRSADAPGFDENLAQAGEQLVGLCAELLAVAGLPPDAELPRRLAVYIGRTDFQPGRIRCQAEMHPADTEETSAGEADLTRDGTHEAKRFDAADDSLADGSVWLEPAIGMFALFSGRPQRSGRRLAIALGGSRS